MRRRLAVLGVAVAYNVGAALLFVALVGVLAGGWFLINGRLP